MSMHPIEVQSTTQTIASSSLDGTPKYDLAVPVDLKIATPAEYSAYGERLKTIAVFKRRVTDFFAPMKRKATEAHRQICDSERQALHRAVEDESRIRRALSAYNEEVERQRRAERAELERQERQRAEAERITQAAALELEAKATGDVSLQEAAEQLITEPVSIAPVTPATPPAPKVDGISFREVWKFDVVNAAAVPREFLMVNEKAVQSVVNGLKDKTSIPGIRVFSEKTTVARTR